MTTTTTAAPVTTWTIDASHTHVAFAVKHLMISTVRGRFTDVDGTATHDERQPERSAIAVRIRAASIDTREPQRDAHLRSSDFLDAEQFPEIAFTSTRLDGDLSGDFTLVGDLSIRGVTRQVALAGTAEGRTTDPWGGERLGFSATAKISRSAFGLTWNQALEAGGVVVGDEVKLTLDVELVKQTA
jgi:polyisoprenoid-binding protein YceI